MIILYGVLRRGDAGCGINMPALVRQKSFDNLTNDFLVVDHKQRGRATVGMRPFMICIT
jgi:hypothetical protein